MSEEFVTAALKALRSADAAVETGPEAEIRALLAFRRQQRRRRIQRMAVWGAVAAGVVLLAWPWPERDTPPQAIAIETPAAMQPVAAPGLETPQPQEQIARGDRQEILTDFFPLMESPPPVERGLLVRMTVPASTMRAVGLPVGDEHLSDPVQADVLVGQDDLARAIRFVIRD